MKKNKTCRTWSGAFSDHVLFPTLGKDNCIFYARARALYRHQTLFPLVRSQDFSPQKMRQNLHVFPRFIPAAHRRMTLGLHVFPRLTRCMFFCAQQQLHVFPQPRYE